MKVITKCVIDMSTLQVIEEKSFQYSGPVAQCGSGGGGGSSGKVDWPQYLKAFQESLLDNAGVDLPISTSMVDVMEVAFAGSPWTGELPYDPDTEAAAMLASSANLQTLVDLLSAGTGLDALIADILSDVRIDNAVTEYSDDLSAIVVADVLPRFEAGMRDINAVVSSAFVIGRANIEEARLREVGKFSAGLHAKAFGDDALRLIALKLESQKFASHMIIEANRLKIVAKKEETDTGHTIDEADATWDLNVFQYAGNLMAAIGGGVSGKPKKSMISSALGGAMTGAAAGFMVGGPTGAVIGGAAGAAAAFLE